MTRGEAYGRPGSTPNWTSSAKQGIGTSLSSASPVWFTLGHGILNEIYFPGVDTANTRDAQYLVADGASFMHEEKRDMKHHVEYADIRSLTFRQTNIRPGRPLSHHQGNHYRLRCPGGSGPYAVRAAAAPSEPLPYLCAGRPAYR